MINAKELRIGNWLKSNLNPVNINVQVDALPLGGSHSEWQIDASLGTYDFKDLDPIPITPEILEKCGIKTVHGSTYLDHDKLNLATIQYDEVKGFVWLDFDGTICGVEIYHLHQLQNLYFALTNEELTINF